MADGTSEHKEPQRGAGAATTTVVVSKRNAVNKDGQETAVVLLGVVEPIPDLLQAGLRLFPELGSGVAQATILETLNGLPTLKALQEVLSTLWLVAQSIGPDGTRTATEML